MTPKVLPKTKADHTGDYARSSQIERGARVTREPLTYERGRGTSFFRDLSASITGDVAARARLERHQAEVEVEHRALDSADTSGGEFVPPIWMQDEWIAVARAGRPFANACRRVSLPPNTDSINVPKVSTGAAAAVQAAEGATVQSTDPVTSAVTAAVNTIAGEVTTSRQLLDRSVPGSTRCCLPTWQPTTRRSSTCCACRARARAASRSAS